MVFYKDFGKTVRDLFKNDKYEFKRTLEVKAKSSPTEWTSKTVIKDDGSISSKHTYKQSDDSLGSWEIKVPTQGNLEVDYQAPKLIEGLKTNLVMQTPNLDLKGKYKNTNLLGRFNCSSEFKATMNTETTSLEKMYIDGSMAFESVSVGGSATFRTGPMSLSDYTVGLTYTQSKDTNIAVTTSSNCNNIATSFYRRVGPETEVACRYNLNVQKPGEPSFEIGGRYQVDESGLVQGFVNPGGNAFMLYKHALSSRLNASLGAVVDTKTWAAGSAKVHYKLEFTA